jgi:hypothetical protein
VNTYDVCCSSKRCSSGRNHGSAHASIRQRGKELDINLFLNTCLINNDNIYVKTVLVLGGKVVGTNTVLVDVVVLDMTGVNRMKLMFNRIKQY